MTSTATHSLHSFVGGLRRDRLLAAVAAVTLALSWYCAAALDGYRIPEHAQQRPEQTAFDRAFLLANAAHENLVACDQGECVRLAEVNASRAEL